MPTAEPLPLPESFPADVGPVRVYQDHSRPNTYELRWRMGAIRHREKITGWSAVCDRIQVIQASLANLSPVLTTAQIREYQSAVDLLATTPGNRPSLVTVVREWIEHERPRRFGRMTLEDAVREYNKERKDLARYNLTSRLLEDLVEATGRIPLSRVTPDHLKSVISDEALAPDTIRTRIFDLRAFFTWCVKRELIARSPATVLPLPKKERKTPKPAKSEDLKKIVKYLRDTEKWQTLIWVLLSAFVGLRASEAARVGKSNRRGATLFLDAEQTKTNRRRSVELHEAFLAWEEFIHQHYHFSSILPYRAPRTLSQLHSELDTACRKTRVYLPRNGLRKGWISHQVARGVPLHQVAQEAGHSESVLHEFYRGLVSAEDPWFFHPHELE